MRSVAIMGTAVVLVAGLVSLPATAGVSADPRAKRPGPPTKVVGAPGDGSVTVSWRIPEGAKRARITRYVVTSQPEGKSCTAVGRNATTCTVAGLTNGSPYTFTVKSYSKKRSSRSSKPSEPVTPQATSSVPTSVVAVAGDGQAAVTWRAPAGTGGYSYTANASPGAQSCTIFPVPGDRLRCVVGNLTNGVAYTFTVTVRFSDGTTGTSGPSAPVTPAPLTAGVIAWGTDNSGMTDVPPELQSAGVSKIAVGQVYALGLKDGGVIEWGTRRCGARLPDGLDSGVTDIATRGDHSLAVRNGGVIAWGCNESGEATVPDAAKSDVTAVASGWSGSRFSLALKDGQVIAWGANDHGQAVVPVAAQSGVSAIAAGDGFALALRDGAVIAWGRNDRGQTNVPSQALSGVTAISAGPSYGLAVKDGSVIAWGDNWWGQTDVPPAALSGVTDVSAGGTYALAISGGRVVIWGTSFLGTVPLPVSAQSGLVNASPGTAEWALLLKG